MSAPESVWPVLGAAICLIIAPGSACTKTSVAEEVAAPEVARLEVGEMLELEEQRHLRRVNAYRLTRVGKALTTRPAPALLGDTVVFSTTRGVAGYALETGKRRWFHKATRLIGRCGRASLLLEGKKELRCVGDAGQERWSKRSPFERITSAVHDDEVVVVAGSGMRLASIDSASGEKLWARMDEDPSADAVRRYPAPKWCGYAMYNYKRAQSAPTVCGDAVVVGTQSGEIVAFSRVTGEQLWRKNVDWPANGPTVAVNNSVFFGTYGQVVALECKSGDLGAALLVEGGMQALLLYGGGIYGQAAMCDVFAAKPEQWPKVTWRFRRCFGSCNNEDYECFSQGGGVLWKAPSDTRAGNKHDGIRLDDPGIRYVHFPEPPPYDGMAPGKMVRNPLLSWKDRWIAVEEQGIVVYEDYAIELDTGE